MGKKKNTKVIQKNVALIPKVFEKITKNETRYKEYKNSFETIKRKFKEYYYTKQIVKYKNNINKTWK